MKRSQQHAKMKNEQTQSGILAAATTIVSFEGRDGDNSYRGSVEVSKLDLSDEAFVSALVELAANTLLHRKGTTAFKALPSVVDAEEFMKVAKSVGSGGAGRYKVSKDDTARAVQLIKDLTNLGGIEAWEAKHEKKATIENIAPMFTAKRAEKAQADAAKEAADRAAELAELKKMLEE